MLTKSLSMTKELLAESSDCPSMRTDVQSYDQVANAPFLANVGEINVPNPSQFGEINYSLQAYSNAKIYRYKTIIYGSSKL